MEDALIIAASVSLAALIVLSAFFSGSETAYTSLSKIRLKNLVNDGNKKAERALKEEYSEKTRRILFCTM